MTREEQAKALRAEGKTFAEIGAILGVTKQAAQQLAVKAPKARRPKAVETRGRKRPVLTNQRCYKCCKVLPLEEFTTAPSRLSGRTNICRGCNAVVSRERKWGKLSIEQLEEQNRQEASLIKLREEYIQRRKSENSHFEEPK